MEQFPLGQRLRRVRHLRDLTQQGLAERSGINVITISRLESGDGHAAQAQTVRDLARALEVSADYLLGLTNDASALFTDDTKATPPATPQPARSQRSRKAASVG